jgi:rRNA-processing protein FCF1
MIHVVLDTNIFYSNRRRDSGPFHALVRLCNGSKVTLHVPYVVKHEFLSQQKELARKHFEDIRGSASKC